jgi:plasmid stabilization system protein ParE
MRVQYAPRAIADAQRIVSYYQRIAGHQVADAFDKRLHTVIDRIRNNPLSLPQVVMRPSVRVALLSRFPYKRFFNLSDDVVTILHIRHTARRQWRGG